MLTNLDIDDRLIEEAQKLGRHHSLKQLTAIGSGSVSVSYGYSSTQNNGKIRSQTDGVSGETVTYTYDSLNRLLEAQSSSSWSQTFTYDTFGNLTNVAGVSAPGFSKTYDTNNHAGGEDANGNPGSIPIPIALTTASATYDVENRLVTVGAYGSAPAMNYGYAPGNRRVWRGITSAGVDEVTFWSVNGQKLCTYQMSLSGSTLLATQTGANLYFGGKLIKNANGWVYSDRLASVGKFYPYGIERPSATANGPLKPLAARPLIAPDTAGAISGQA